CDSIIIAEPRIDIKLPFSSRQTEQKPAFKKTHSPKIWKNTLKKLEVKGGTICYYNASSKSSIEDISLILNDFSLTNPSSFSLKGHVVSGENRTELAASGRILHIPESFQIADMEIESSVRISSLKLEDFRWIYERYAPFEALSGTVDVCGTYNGTFRGSFNSSGKIVFNNTTLSYRDIYEKDIAVTKCAIDYNYEMNREKISIKEFSLNSDGFLVNGMLNLLNYRFPDRYISANVSIKDSTSAIPVDFKGKVILENNVTSVEIEKGIYDDIKIIAPHLPLYIKDRILHINGVNLEVADGEAELSGKLDFSSSHNIEFDSTYKTKNIDVQKLVSKFGVKNLTFSGTLNCEGNIRSSGSSIDEMIKNLDGNLNVTLNNGYLTEQHVLVRMFTIINMYDVIKLRLPKMDKDRIKYKTVTAKTVINSGMVNVKSLRIDGDRIRISGRGDINLSKESMNMVFGVELFQIIDEVLNKIPIIGYIITGENGNLLAFYVKLKSHKDGYLNVTVVPHELLGDVTIRLFQRLLKLPLRMMTPIMKSTNDRKKNIENER
ncbi:AsmA-like C-terminal domain-containing protein, partial [bacterium]|nr:AsmA-like C-terminal domain-containing protein [bacterium]